MKATIIVESCFGNTAQVAGALVEELREAGADTELLTADQAPDSLRTDLVIIAAPTHNMGLPNAKTRQQAVEKGATSQHSTGVREWIDALQSIDGRVLTTATTTGGMMSGSAGKAAVKALRRKKVKAEQGQDFLVDGTEGPLAADALVQAKTWARSLISG